MNLDFGTQDEVKYCFQLCKRLTCLRNVEAGDQIRTTCVPVRKTLHILYEEKAAPRTEPKRSNSTRAIGD